MTRYEAQISRTAAEAFMAVIEESDEKGYPISEIKVTNSVDVADTSWTCYIFAIEG